MSREEFEAQEQAAADHARLIERWERRGIYNELMQQPGLGRQNSGGQALGGQGFRSLQTVATSATSARSSPPQGTVHTTSFEQVETTAELVRRFEQARADLVQRLNSLPAPAPWVQAGAEGMSTSGNTQGGPVNRRRRGQLPRHRDSRLLRRRGSRLFH